MNIASIIIKNELIWLSTEHCINSIMLCNSACILCSFYLFILQLIILYIKYINIYMIYHNWSYCIYNMVNISIWSITINHIVYTIWSIYQYDLSQLIIFLPYSICCIFSLVYYLHNLVFLWVFSLYLWVKKKLNF